MTEPITNGIRWRNKPEKIDVLNSHVIFGRVSKWGIPTIDPCDFVPSMLAAWHDPRGREDAAKQGGALHFFLDDYRFERVWSDPHGTLDRIKTVGAALSPDFSMWRDMPPAMQLWQLYRSRWCAAWWQYNKVNVIPTVGWGRPETFEFVFEGLPHESVLAISIVGIKSAYAHKLFREGLERLVEDVHPTMLLCYGKLPYDPGVPVTEYPTLWDQRRTRKPRGRVSE